MLKSATHYLEGKNRDQKEKGIKDFEDYLRRNIPAKVVELPWIK